MTYPVVCECGATTQVPGSAAGTTVTCRCGRAVEVPSLAKLKRAAGQTVVSAEFEIEQLLVAGALPAETACVLCATPTGHQATYTVTCELVEERPEIPTWQWVGVFVLFLCAGIGLVALALLLLMNRPRAAGPHGRDVVFRLPVRVCEGCKASLTTTEAVRDALRETPVYDRLFGQFPRARITNAD